MANVSFAVSRAALESSESGGVEARLHSCKGLSAKSHGLRAGGEVATTARGDVRGGGIGLPAAHARGEHARAGEATHNLGGGD